MKKMLSLTSLAAASLLALSACGSTSTTSSSASASAGKTSSASASATAHATASATASASVSTQANGLEITDTWVKSTTGSMTAVFGKIKNTTDKPITIVKAENDVADMVQLHTTTLDSKGTSSMKQVDSFTIQPGETFELAPGGNHIMLMGMHCTLPAGTHVHMTIVDSNGNSYKFKANARDYSAAQETYAPGASASASAMSMNPSSTAMSMDHSSMSPSASAMPMDSHMSMSMMPNASASAMGQCD